ncbi:MAG: hypothetical protein AAGG57_17420 [Pseudomonadota bacterium]
MTLITLKTACLAAFIGLGFIVQADACVVAKIDTTGSVLENFKN